MGACSLQWNSPSKKDGAVSQNDVCQSKNKGRLWRNKVPLSFNEGRVSNNEGSPTYFGGLPSQDVEASIIINIEDAPKSNMMQKCHYVAKTLIFAKRLKELDHRIWNLRLESSNAPNPLCL